MCNTVLQPQNVIAALGHNWCEATCTAAKTCATCATTEGEALGHSEQILDSLSPTCIQPGLTEGKRCTRCDHVLVEQQTIPAFGHTWQAATCTMPKTCLACAVTEGEPLPHTQIPLNAQAPTCRDTGLTEGIGCAGCDTILQEQKTVPAFGHSWLDATCQAPATCEVCKLTQGSPLPHQAIVEGAFSPTCTTPGSTGTILCSACSTQLEAPLAIAAIGHADMDEDRICDLCTHHLINPTKIAIVAVLCVSTVAAAAAVAIILIRKRKVK
jgi:hypothetical protein